MAKIHINNPKQVINGGAKKYYFKVKGLGGPKGDKGDTGATGPQGPQGPQGNAATVSVGSTTTLPVGQDATVQNVGTLYNAVLNFGIPQGPRGPQGATGATGAKGDKGDQGNPGPQGEKGTNATVYVGTTSTLNPGSQATVYNSGTDSNAVLNFGIPKGEKGDTGSQGPQGPIGPAGADGESFTPVVVSSLPTTGDEGKLYLTPKDYTTGTGTGNPITATITDEAGKIESFQLDGDTYQQTYTGKNLLGLKKPSSNTFGFEPAVAEESGTITVDGTFTGGGGGFPWISDRQLSIPAGTYTFSMKTPQSFNVSLRMFDAQGQYTSGKYIAAGATSGTFTLDYDCVRVAILIGAFSTGKTLNNQKFEELQLEAGSTATSFEPFVGGQPSPNPDYPQPIQTVTGEQTISINGTNYPISLGSLELCKLGDYQDYIYRDGEEWKVHKATAKAIFNGSESWFKSGSSTSDYLYAALVTTDMGISYDGKASALMDEFTFMPTTAGNRNSGRFYLYNGTTVAQHITCSMDTSVTSTPEEFKTWLSTHPATLYYPLYIATDTTITDTTLIAQLEAIRTASLQNGANTITNTATGSNLAGDMEISYYEYDPTNRYDKWLWLRANNAYEEFDEEGGGGGGGSITVDSALSTTSKNPVQNKVVTAAINSKVDSSSLATVATSGSYNDLSNKPTIPTVNNGTLTIRQNGTTIDTFTANQSTNVTVDLSDTTYSDFVGATSSAAGSAGLVPAPTTSDPDKFLKGDGTWGAVTTNALLIKEWS